MFGILTQNEFTEMVNDFFNLNPKQTRFSPDAIASLYEHCLIDDTYSQNMSTRDDIASLCADFEEYTDLDQYNDHTGNTFEHHNEIDDIVCIDNEFALSPRFLVAI